MTKMNATQTPARSFLKVGSLNMQGAMDQYGHYGLPIAGGLVGAGLGAGVHGLQRLFGGGGTTDEERSQGLKSSLLAGGGVGAGVGLGRLVSILQRAKGAVPQVKTAREDDPYRGLSTKERLNEVEDVMDVEDLAKQQRYAGVPGFQPMLPQRRIRRPLTEQEGRDVARGRSQWLPQTVKGVGVPLSMMMASPWKQALMAGLAGGAGGALAGGSIGGAAQQPALGAAIGGLGVGGVAALLAGLRRSSMNKSLMDLMKRMPPNAAAQSPNSEGTDYDTMLSSLNTMAKFSNAPKLSLRSRSDVAAAKAYDWLCKAADNSPTRDPTLQPAATGEHTVSYAIAPRGEETKVPGKTSSPAA